MTTEFCDEAQLISAALALGARDVRGWSSAEERLIRDLPAVDPETVSELHKQITRGGDPLGEILCKLRSPAERRHSGATYTPLQIVAAMLSWAQAQGEPARVVEPGAGSARFILQAGRRFINAELVGCELDPTAAIIARANLAAAGFARRTQIVVGDYRDLELAPIDGRTLYIGNPPYVRHHSIGEKWKQWLVKKAAKLGFKASQLSGLHVHFFLSTVVKARRGDYGSFITAGEWLDVNYGSLVRELFLGPLGGERIIIIDPTAAPFPDATTTAAITCFEIGSQRKAVRVKRLKSHKNMALQSGGRVLKRERLENEPRWSTLMRPRRECRQDFVQLGELCRVHRGQVTGSNKVWIAGKHSEELPESVLFPAVTKARELISAAPALIDLSLLRRVIDIPADLSSFSKWERGVIDRFLRWAQAVGADGSFIAKNRRAWWSVGLREPAPILATYMARRPPAFVRNLAGARHINIAHGLYPRQPLADNVLNGLVSYLSDSTNVADGRTYAGGLTKFEPREMERILVPEPSLLISWRNDRSACVDRGAVAAGAGARH